MLKIFELTKVMLKRWRKVLALNSHIQIMRGGAIKPASMAGNNLEYSFKDAVLGQQCWMSQKGSLFNKA